MNCAMLRCQRGHASLQNELQDYANENDSDEILPCRNGLLVRGLVDGGSGGRKAGKCRIVYDTRTWEETALPAELPPWSILCVECE